MGHPRISARRGQIVDLNITFYNNGIPTDPYAIRKVEIYKTQVLPHNLLATIPVVELADPLYPLPITQDSVASVTGDCGTEPSSDAEPIAGKYTLQYTIPNDFTVPDVFFDLWYFYPSNPCGELGTEDVTGCNIDDVEYADFLQKCCHRFWVYPDEWFCDDGLQSIKFGFEPLDQKFNSPEVRPLEIGLMPLPLYDYNFNLVNPMIPFIQASITVETYYRELLVDNEPMTIGIRQGSYRSNPYVLRWNLDTTRFLKGTYQYKVKLTLPDGSTRVSKTFVFSIQ